jgi:Toxin SymE, type I toxin-antitoxin system
MTKQLTVSRIYAVPKKFSNKPLASRPYIRIKGKWLEELGFQPGDKITITQNYNHLTITKT